MQGYFVETTRNANEETIRKYVQEQLIELDQKEVHSDQLGLFLTERSENLGASVLTGRILVEIV